MSIHHLEHIFKPKSIAVIGASERQGSVGSVIMNNLIEAKFPGKIFPINPNHKMLWDMPTYPVLQDLNEPVDLAIIAVPIASATDIIRSCVGLHVGDIVSNYFQISRSFCHTASRDVYTSKHNNLPR